MYLARFKFSGEDWLQGCAALKPVGWASGKWTSKFESLIRSICSEPSLRLAYRLSAGPDGLSRILFVLGNASFEPQITSTFESLGRLNLLVGGASWMPGSRQEHDALVELFPIYRCPLTLPVYSVAEDVWVANDFHLAKILPTLIAEALDNGHTFSYHINLEPLSRDLSLYREARKNVARLSLVPGAPPIFIAGQEYIVERMKNAPYLGEEILGVATEGDMDWLSRSLKRHFSEAVEPVHLDPPDFAFELENSERYDLSLVATRCCAAFEELSAPAACSSCFGVDEVVELLTWQGSEAIEVGEKEESPSPEVWAPSPCENEDGYIFISYKRQDLRRIVHFMKTILSWGYKIWYDREIPGGTEWDTVIAQRLTGCRAVLFFMSHQSLQSRYVRREIKFADSISKPVIPVRLEECEPEDGLKMFLSQYQVLDTAGDDFTRRLQSSIRNIFPE